MPRPPGNHEPDARARILLALGSAREAEALANALEADGHALARSADADEARARLPQGWDVVVADLSFELLAPAREAPGSPAVILIASLGTIGDAAAAVRAGAFDLLSRPTTAAHLRLSLARALEQRRLARENERLRASLERGMQLGNLHSCDPRMQRIAEVIEAVADTRASVLITGESGTGKTQLARALHNRSSRAKRPFVLVDCGALPPTLIESELFGHARGSFTGAVRDKAGLIESADGGTLFLDEIGNAPLELQAKLLRVVQERVFERVGETRTREVDVRWIAATNRDLAREVAAGRFREDLYYRIQVVALEIPPLRERAGDVALLAELFTRRFAREHGRAADTLEPEALAALAAALWPGNVRQLEHTLERAVLLARGARVTLADLGPEFDREGGPALPAALPHAPGGSLKRALEEPERALIARALEHNHGNRQRTAAMLGLNRSTLFNKMRKYDLLGIPSRPLPGATGHAPGGRAT